MCERKHRLFQSYRKNSYSSAILTLCVIFIPVILGALGLVKK